MTNETIPQQREVLRTLVAAQVLSGAGLAAGVSVGALLAQDMFASERLTGVPSALFTTGSAAAAVLVGQVSGRRGRRPGLALGYIIGALGAVLVVVAAKADSVPLLLPAMLIYGAGTATNLQARYAGADLARPDHRGRAISTVLVATTVGAVIGPNAVSTMGNLATRMGIPRLAGPFMLSGLAYGLAGAVLWSRLRPDPLLLARELAATEIGSSSISELSVDAGSGDDSGKTPVAERVDGPGLNRGVLLGAAVMVTAQIVMVAIMTMTPVHMREHGHALGATGIVISAHIAGMYLPSLATGALVDRFGPRVIAVSSGVVLAIAGVLAASVPDSSVFGLAIALVVLGAGWNLGLLSGTSLVTAATPLERRARTQGKVDLSIAIAGATGGLGSGALMASSSYSTLGVLGAIVAVGSLPLVALGGSSRSSTEVPETVIARARIEK